MQFQYQNTIPLCLYEFWERPVSFFTLTFCERLHKYICFNWRVAYRGGRGKEAWKNATEETKEKCRL
jgi:hypothetical protein